MQVKIQRFVDKYLIWFLCLAFFWLKYIPFRKEKYLKYPKRILVIRLWALWSSLLTFPMIKQLKDFYLMKPNFKEFCVMIGKDIENEDKQIEKYWIEFVENINTNLVITRWAKWASLITKDGNYYHIATQAQKVFDVSGAGDTFIATIAYALNKWYDLKDALKLWNKASGIVVEKVGTAVVTKEELF